ncbi:nicotinate-nucleotide adenylyltransferase [Halalkalibacillus halophilus]|uniref:nicotinate-nucleotide adenylyltransferase n=1 Tax=Halalkalibacillus halophilus TaxID=392827 RepID=UPI000420D991|nr:nicotinate-nucleotide adenylyltransferase [Halalkalibacillus halophilus]
MKKIALFGGTFDPPHIGHLAICNAVWKQTNVDEIWFIPTYTPPHKEPANVSFDHRLNMLKLLMQKFDSVKVLSIEKEREGKSYTIDTVFQIKQRFPDYEFKFIIGGDMVEYLPNWHRIDDLKKLLTFIGISRVGYTFSDADIEKIEMDPVNVSSSTIRSNIKSRGVYDGLTASVAEYIKEHRLYEH